jgi:hypothetical protein
MHGFLRSTRAAVLGLALLALAGCENKIPTAAGTDLFPDGTTPQSLDVTVPASAFLVSDTIYTGYTTLADAPYLLVAERYRGSLTAHALVRFDDLPDSVTYVSGGATTSTKDFTYSKGRVITVVDSIASVPRSPVTLRLWALDQAWDTTGVTWESTGTGDAWRTPGGTLGTLLGEADWVPGDTVTADSVVWQVDSLAVQRLAGGDFAGLAVTAATGARLQISTPMLSIGVHPSTKPDTVVTLPTIHATARATVFTPAPPAGKGYLRVGGPMSDRAILRIRLPASVPGCEPSESCDDEALSRVTLNRVTLDLRTAPVPDGFGPVDSTIIQIRRVLEPELGRRAPLGEVLVQDTVSPAQFVAGGDLVPLDVTATARAELAAGRSELVVAVLALPVNRFSYLWFTTAPGLRLVYTLPLNLSLP